MNWDGVYLVFGSEGLVGYGIGPYESSAVTVIDQDVSAGATPEGLRLGSTVATATETYGARFSFFPESTLGYEFTIRDVDGWPYLSGLANGEAPDSLITYFFAGEVCAAR